MKPTATHYDSVKTSPVVSPHLTFIGGADAPCHKVKDIDIFLLFSVLSHEKQTQTHRVQSMNGVIRAYTLKKICLLILISAF